MNSYKIIDKIISNLIFFVVATIILFIVTLTFWGIGTIFKEELMMMLGGA